MTQDVFKHFVNALRYSYELRRAPDEQMDYWYSKAGGLPDECLEWLRDRIKREYPERFPKHFQDVLLRLFSEWRWTTGKQAQEPECPECDGGFVSIMEPDERYPGELLAVGYACGRCRKSLQGIKKLTKTQARRQGLLLVDAKATAGDVRDFREGLKGVVAAMVSTMDAAR